ncbi:hypothetical protein [Thermoactinomyces sp. CICC 23799]|uniref:hypothetical protein n=1 Tax=Thermoactinomyces sp. CICC 23799 TaxID=2767429 RepID=UPI0018DC19F3|nr:hypothetical protein [Thermoactinomyces sp. CICC 23799]MBH8601474.1 hypothetical protein [Thermoactinomyces sp. CICC 23799]
MRISISENDLIKIIEEHLQNRLNKSITLKDANFYQYEEYEGYVELWGYAQFQAEIEFDKEQEKEPTVSQVAKCLEDALLNGRVNENMPISKFIKLVKAEYLLHEEE